MKTEHTTENDEAVAAFKDDPFEIVRCLAGVATQRAKMTPEERAAEPDPLDDWSPMVLAARRICLLNGYSDDGSERPGFMERQARAKLAAQGNLKVSTETLRRGDVITGSVTRIEYNGTGYDLTAYDDKGREMFAEMQRRCNEYEALVAELAEARVALSTHK